MRTSLIFPRLATTLMAMLLAASTYAQTTDTTDGGRWKIGFETGLEVTQTAYSDNSLRANLTSILQMSLGWQLLYDKEIHEAGRFKETLSLGLADKVSNVK